MRFFHQGQFEGFRKRISPHLVRGPDEPVDEAVRAYYDRLLAVLRLPVVRQGQWRLLECAPAWDGNWTSDCFVAFGWELDEARLIVVVNFADHPSQCHVRLPLAGLAEAAWRCEDRLGDRSYDWRGEDLVARGLFVDCHPWQACAFSMTKT